MEGTMNVELELKGHERPVLCIIQLSNGLIVSCSLDWSIRVWDINNYNSNLFQQKCIKEIFGHKGIVYKILELPNGLLVSCSEDKTIRVYDMKNDFICKKILKVHTDDVTSICQFGDGKLVSGSNDKNIIIWDYVRSFKQDEVLQGNQSGITYLLVLLNGKLASGTNKGEIRIWDDQEPYNCIKIIENDDKLRIYDMCNINDSNFAVAIDYGRINIFRIFEDEYELSQNIDAYYDTVSTIKFTSNGLLFSGSGYLDCCICLLDPNKKFECVKKFKEESDYIYSVCELNSGLIAYSSKTLIKIVKI